MPNPESTAGLIEKELRSRTITGLITGVLGLGGASVAFLRRDLFQLFDKVPGIIFATAAGCLLLLNILLSVWIWDLKKQAKKPLQQGLIFLPKSGCYWDEEKKQAICTTCIANGQRIAMMELGRKGPYHCMACQQSFPAND